MDLSLIRSYEGLRLHAYPDPESGSAPWTIGYGSTHHVDGTPVRPGEVVTEAQAEAMLDAYVEREILPSVQHLPGWAEMTPGQQGALVDLCYNLGPGIIAPSHTIGAALAERRWADVPAALLLYSDPGTACHEGLLRRREAEAALWRQGMQQPITVTLDTGHGSRTVPARVYLDGGHAMVGVRAMTDAVGYALTTAEGTATFTDAMQTPHTLALTITDGVGYVQSAALAQALGLTVAYDAVQHALRFSAGA